VNFRRGLVTSNCRTVINQDGNDRAPHAAALQGRHCQRQRRHSCGWWWKRHRMLRGKGSTHPPRISPTRNTTTPLGSVGAPGHGKPSPQGGANPPTGRRISQEAKAGGRKAKGTHNLPDKGRIPLAREGADVGEVVPLKTRKRKGPNRRTSWMRNPPQTDRRTRRTGRPWIGGARTGGWSTCVNASSGLPAHEPGCHGNCLSRMKGNFHVRFLGGWG
jgi:hypothetical protein